VWVRGEVGEERGVRGGGEDVGHVAGAGWLAGGGGQLWAKLEDERVTNREKEKSSFATAAPRRAARARTLRRQLGGARHVPRAAATARPGPCSVSLVTPLPCLRAAHATMRCQGKGFPSLFDVLVYWLLKRQARRGRDCCLCRG
jgi:hypothetical protein